ncbi:MAG: hypothetical protein GY716_06125 [bacterium]|nr:hypothetical protein [bacterium]
MLDRVRHTIVVVATVALAAGSAAAVGFVPPDAIPKGPLACGEIREADVRFEEEVHAWTIQGGRGEWVNIATQPIDDNDGFAPMWALIGPGGSSIGLPRDRDSVRMLPEFGTYTIVVFDSMESLTGRYAIQVQWLSESGSCAREIQCGTPTRGRFDAGIDHDVYSFLGKKGGVLHIAGGAELDSDAPDPVWTLLGPDGAVASGSRMRTGAVRLQHDGRYALLVEDRALERTGDYVVSLNGIADGSSCGLQLEDTRPAKVDLAWPGERQSFQFTGREGDVARLAFRRDARDPVDVRWELYDPRGLPVADGSAAPSDVTLERTGTHTLVVFGEVSDCEGRGHVELERLLLDECRG